MVLPNGERRYFQRLASLLVGTLCLVSRILRCLFAPLILLVVDKSGDGHDGLLMLLERLRLGLLKDLKLRLHQHHALGRVGMTRYLRRSLEHGNARQTARGRLRLMVEGARMRGDKTVLLETAQPQAERTKSRRIRSANECDVGQRPLDNEVKMAGSVQGITKEEMEGLRRAKPCRLLQSPYWVAHGWPASKRRPKARAQVAGSGLSGAMNGKDSFHGPC